MAHSAIGLVISACQCLKEVTYGKDASELKLNVGASEGRAKPQQTRPLDGPATEDEGKETHLRLSWAPILLLTLVLIQTRAESNNATLDKFVHVYVPGASKASNYRQGLYGMFSPFPSIKLLRYSFYTVVCPYSRITCKCVLVPWIYLQRYWYEILRSCCCPTCSEPGSP